MSVFDKKIAIVTGAASGIGKEISRALVARGTHVVLTDIDATMLESTVAEIGGSVESRLLDVTDAAAVKALVNEVAQAHGHLDFMFNNAGIAMFGHAKDMPLDDWNKLIDVNLRGVVHGVTAAYPIMIKQRSGHIVNTASVAGLAPVPGGTIYGMTKHAVVGLSTSLRGEARHFGVRVSAICPGFINTPLVQSAKMVNLDREAALAELPVPLASPTDLAQKIMHGVERNQSLIVFTPFAHISWRLYRLSPTLFERLLAFNRKNPLLAK